MEYAGSWGPLGFWLFLAAIIVAGIWSDIRKRESQQETLRRVVESGQQLDAALIDKMLDASGGKERKDEELKTAGIIVFFVSLGMPVLGFALAQFNEKVFTVMLGVGGLIFMVATGLYVAGTIAARRYNNDRENHRAL